MKFKISELKRLVNFNSKPKRNVVYKIGYDKFSAKKFFEKFKNYITSKETKRKYREFYVAFKNLFK